MDPKIRSIRRKPVPDATKTNIPNEMIPMASPAPKLNAPVKEEPKPAKRLSRKLTKRLSLPAPVSKKEGKGGSMTSTFSLPNILRSSSPPNSTTTFTPPSPSLPTTGSDIAAKPLPLPPAAYDPLENYIPCLFPTCTAHYLLAALGPTFYAPSAPYQLSRKQGLCMTHTGKELRQANERCKAEFESMRQNAGRKTLGIVDAEFEMWLIQFRALREEEITDCEMALKRRVQGVCKQSKSAKRSQKKDKEKDTEDELWDWAYTPRRCTSSTCPAPLTYYSPYDQRFYLWYHTPRITGLFILQSLCPACARRNVDEAERKRSQAWQDMHPQEWREWMEQLNRNRAKEQEFWEKAQESRVRERGPAVRHEAGGDGDVEKGGNLLEDLCVVM